MYDNTNAKERFKMLLMQWALVGVLFCASGAVYYFLTVRTHGNWVGLFPLDISFDTWKWLLLGLTFPLGVFFLLKTLAPPESIYDENVKLATELYSIGFMVPFLFVNALMEEILFRGALQLAFGVLPSALLFTAAHVSYYKKPLLMLEVFTLGVFFSFLFVKSGSLWVCSVSHAVYNFIVMVLIKTGKIKYEQ